MYRLVCLLLVSFAAGEVIKDGVCNYAEIGGFVSDLDIKQILGTWYQIARYNNDQEVGECSSLVLDGQYGANETLIGVNATHVEFHNKTKSTNSGLLEPVASDLNALFSVNITGFYAGKFVVQATNYTDYAILYSCETLSVATEGQGNNTKVVRAWQYHKKATLSTAELAAVKEIVDVNPDLKDIQWKQVDHSKTACGNGGVVLAVPHVLIILATLFISKELV